MKSAEQQHHDTQIQAARAAARLAEQEKERDDAERATWDVAPGYRLHSAQKQSARRQREVAAAAAKARAFEAAGGAAALEHARYGQPVVVPARGKHPRVIRDSAVWDQKVAKHVTRTAADAWKGDRAQELTGILLYIERIDTPLPLLSKDVGGKSDPFFVVYLDEPTPAADAPVAAAATPTGSSHTGTAGTVRPTPATTTAAATSPRAADHTASLFRYARRTPVAADNLQPVYDLSPYPGFWFPLTRAALAVARAGRLPVVFDGWDKDLAKPDDWLGQASAHVRYRPMQFGLRAVALAMWEGKKPAGAIRVTYRFAPSVGTLTIRVRNVMAADDDPEDEDGSGGGGGGGDVKRKGTVHRPPPTPSPPPGSDASPASGHRRAGSNSSSQSQSQSQHIVTMPLKLQQPHGLCYDPVRHVLYVSDTGAHRIRCIDLRDHTMRTVAGTGVAGLVDGPAARAQFHTPCGLAYDPATDALYVADSENAVLRMVQRGLVTTVAGLGIPDGPDEEGSGASPLLTPGGLLKAAKPAATPSVAQLTAAALAAVDANREAQLRATAATDAAHAAPSSVPLRMAAATATAAALRAAAKADDAQRALQVQENKKFVQKVGHLTPQSAAASGTAGVAKSNAKPSSASSFDFGIADAQARADAAALSASGVMMADGPARLVRLGKPFGLALGKRGCVWFTDVEQHAVRVLRGGVVDTVVGDGVAGYYNGPCDDARLTAPMGIAVDARSGAVYVTERGRSGVRVIVDGEIHTVAGGGDSDNCDGFADGVVPELAAAMRDAAAALTGATAVLREHQAAADHKSGFAALTALPMGPPRFHQPFGVCVDPAGNVVVLDTANHRVRLLRHGRVSTVAGNGGTGHVDGVARHAELRHPTAGVLDRDGTLYVAADSTVRTVPFVALEARMPRRARPSASAASAADGKSPASTPAKASVTAAAAGGSGAAGESIEESLRKALADRHSPVDVPDAPCNPREQCPPILVDDKAYRAALARGPPPPGPPPAALALAASKQQQTGAAVRGSVLRARIATETAVRGERLSGSFLDVLNIEATEPLAAPGSRVFTDPYASDVAPYVVVWLAEWTGQRATGGGGGALRTSPYRPKGANRAFPVWDLVGRDGRPTLRLPLTVTARSFLRSGWLELNVEVYDGSGTAANPRRCIGWSNGNVQWDADTNGQRTLHLQIMTHTEDDDDGDAARHRDGEEHVSCAGALRLTLHLDVEHEVPMPPGVTAPAPPPSSRAKTPPLAADAKAGRLQPPPAAGERPKTPPPAAGAAATGAGGGAAAAPYTVASAFQWMRKAQPLAVTATATVPVAAAAAGAATTTTDVGSPAAAALLTRAPSLTGSGTATPHS